ncbi:MAG: hypothetical protein H6970_15635 [Gammaproteobacteria bacterium]|nr:hypothetical protein [Gammaproteobacteria bacterium]MCP5426476.1 hypothetical protein [Gammaproteobacteria bacterium]
MLQLSGLETLRFINRMFYAFLLTTLVVGVVMVLDMVFAFGMGPFMFSEAFVVPCFVVAYLLTPYIEKRIKLD